eukprot:COSAG02_NODE_1538_length_12042_cov_323.842083_3_plen_96_part_00
MDVFEQEESSPQPPGEVPNLSVEVPENEEPESVETIGRAADSGDEPDGASVAPGTPTGFSAVDSVFDVEERGPTKKKKTTRFVSVPGPYDAGASE